MSKRFKNFFDKYISNLNNILKNIDPKQLEKLSYFFENLIKTKKRIFIAGNGGSASTASTMTNDLGFDLFKKKKKFVNFQSLVDNISVITAISNDTGYENLFLNQLKMQHKIGDHLLVISASGNSKNLISAIKFVKKRKGKIISFLGFDGGKVKKYSDILIHLKTEKGQYGPVEDAHLIINHVLSHWFQDKSK
mgnify:FL=1|tara:strand:- start:1857 stop:2435 length:579 start_codon:yes stop_codon:yes gene_type:complete